MDLVGEEKKQKVLAKIAGLPELDQLKVDKYLDHLISCQNASRQKLANQCIRPVCPDRPRKES